VPQLRIGTRGADTVETNLDIRHWSRMGPSSAGHAPETEVRVITLGTGGNTWNDRSGASFLRDRYFPPTAVDRPTIAVLEIRAESTIGTLKEFLVPLAQRVRGGEYGQLFLVVRPLDDDVAEYVRYLSREYELPILVSSSVSEGAIPVGALTSTEEDTIEALRALGGASTPPELAKAIGIELSAAGNRLVNLERKRYLYRISRPRREGDLFIDPWATRSQADRSPATR
jgi:hypothetical protein